MFLIFCPLCWSLSLCCFSPVWHLNSKAAFKWRWMAELPHTINKRMFVSERDMSCTQSSACFTLLQYIHWYCAMKTQWVVVSGIAQSLLGLMLFLHEWFNRMCIVELVLWTSVYVSLFDFLGGTPNTTILMITDLWHIKQWNCQCCSILFLMNTNPIKWPKPTMHLSVSQYFATPPAVCSIQPQGQCFVTGN